MVVGSEFAPEEDGKHVTALRKSLISKDETIRAKDNRQKVEKMDVAQDLCKPPNAQMRRVGEDIPPRLLGYFPFSEFRLNKAVPILEQELNRRGIKFHGYLNVTAKLDLLKAHEKNRYEQMVNQELGKRGMSCCDSVNLDLNKKLKLLQQDACDNNETLSSIYRVTRPSFGNAFLGINVN